MDEERTQDLVADFKMGRLSRRQFLKSVISVASVATAEALLVSCQSQAPSPSEVEEMEEAAPTTSARFERPEEMRRIQWVDCTEYIKDPPWKVGAPAQGPTNSWALMYDGHVEYGLFEKYADYFSDYFYADSGGNAAKQISDLESILVKGPDIILGGALGAAGKEIFDSAFDSGIPLVVSQLPYESEKYVSFVNPDNYLNGAKCAEWVAEKINGKGKIVLTSGIAGTDTAESRLQGAKDVFAKYPDIEQLAHGYMDWSISKAKQGFEAWVASFPEIDAVWSDSAFMAWGAIEAFVEANRDIPPMTAEPLNGFLKLCKQHGVEFFCRGYPNAFGLDIVDMAVRVLMGEVVPKYQFVPSLEFETPQLEDYLREDLPDDLWLDYRYPRTWVDKQFGG